MGFVVFTETQLKKAFTRLEESVLDGQAFDAIVYYLEEDDTEVIEFAEAILGRSDLKFIKQLALVSPLGLASPAISSLRLNPNFHTIARPVGIFELETHLQPLIKKSRSDESDLTSPAIVLFNPDKKHLATKQWLSEFAVVTEVNTVENLCSHLAHNPVALIACVIDVLGLSEHMLVQLRSFERNRQQEFFTPVIGIGTAEQAYSAYQIGVDHFLDREANSPTRLHELKYWSGVFSTLSR
jgi:hypothetical protein